MKMPEPVTWIYQTPLYDKQALIDLLEAAAQLCDARADGENDAQYCADVIRSKKETL